MAVQYFCDRCKKRLSESEKNGERYQIRQANDKISPLRWSSSWRDLCKKCSDELAIWLTHASETRS